MTAHQVILLAVLAMAVAMATVPALFGTSVWLTLLVSFMDECPCIADDAAKTWVGARAHDTD